LRVGATNRLADREMIQSLERQRLNISFDEEVLPHIDMKTLNIHRLITEMSELMSRSISELDLINLKLIKKDENDTKATRGIILLTYGHDDMEYARVRCARFKGLTTDEFIDQKDFEGPLYNQVQNAMKFVRTHIAKSGKINGLQREDQYAIPMVAIREAIVNAVVHRDYSISGSDIKVAIFDDRIEITSPGTLPKSMDLQDLLSGRSEIRNKVIARIFKEMDLIEQWGSGIRRMIEACSSQGLGKPKFIETGLFFKVVFYSKEAESDVYKKVPDKMEKVPDKIGKVPDKMEKVPDTMEKEQVITQLKLSKSGRIIYNYLVENAQLNISEVQSLTGLSERGSRNALQKLAEKGLIEKSGSGPKTHYVLGKK